MEKPVYCRMVSVLHGEKMIKIKLKIFQNRGGKSGQILLIIKADSSYIFGSRDNSVRIIKCFNVVYIIYNNAYYITYKLMDKNYIFSYM